MTDPAPVGPADPVFVDRTGRRRRFATAVGAALAVLLASSLALLIAGLLGASPMPLPGLPSNGQQVQPATSSPGARHTGTVPLRSGVGSRTPGGAVNPSASDQPTVPPTRGNRPSSHPGNGTPRPSKSR